MFLKLNLVNILLWQRISWLFNTSGNESIISGHATSPFNIGWCLCAIFKSGKYLQWNFNFQANCHSRNGHIFKSACLTENRWEGTSWNKHHWQIFRITNEVLESRLHRIQRTPCACEGCEHWCMHWQGLHSLLVCTFTCARYAAGEKSLSCHEGMESKYDT